MTPKEHKSLESICKVNCPSRKGRNKVGRRACRESNPCEQIKFIISERNDHV